MNRPASSRHPPFNMWQEFATVTGPPPFAFPKTTIRYFPLRADIEALRRLCDDYLNVAPEFAVFRPAMPFVMLCVANYGRMSQAAGNLGWTSQNELFFSVPVLWYERRRNGKLRFRAMAQNSPFIFVDNESSQVEGREVFGWPKVQGWFARTKDAWTEHPLANRELLRLSAHVFGKLYRKERPEPRDLIVIEESPPPNFSAIPPRPGDPNGLISSSSRSMVEWLRLLLRGYESMLGPLWGGMRMSDTRALMNAMPQISTALVDIAEQVTSNTINLKQQRDAEHPMEICYQALTNAEVNITRIRQNGLLGETAMARGDLSGGHRIHIHRYDSQPIVETLGLEVDSERTGDSTGTSTLTPVMPFWQEVDLEYARGARLCWRTKHDYWRNRQRRAIPRSPDIPAFNTIGSSAFQVASGPFIFKNVSMRVLPLLACKDTLQDFCNRYLNADLEGQTHPEVCYTPYGNHVYLTVMAFDEMAAKNDNIGQWARTQVAFFVPVRCMRGTQVDSIALVSPFMYSDSDIGTTTAREVNGWPMLKSQISSPPNPWVSHRRPIPGVSQIEVKIEGIAAINTGQEMLWHRLIEVMDGFRPKVPRDWKGIADTWGARIKDDAQSMQRTKDEDPKSFRRMRALSLEVLARRQPLNQIALKQFRNAAEAWDACYQAHVKTPTTCTEIHDLQEIEHPLHVRINRLPTQPLVDMLGLVVKYEEITDEGIIDILEPSRPFYVRADLESQLGTVLCWRSESSRWTFPGEDTQEESPSAPYFGPGQQVELRAEDADEIDADPTRLNAIARSQERPRPVDAFRKAAESNVTPQMLISAMLSREWNHQGTPRSRRLAPRPDDELPEAPQPAGTLPRFPDFVVRTDSVGDLAAQVFPPSERVRLGDLVWPYWTPERGNDR